MYTLDELLLFENLTYLADVPPFRSPFGFDDLTLGEFLKRIDFEQIDDEKDYASFITGYDWKNMITAILNKPHMTKCIMKETHVDQAYGGGLGFSLVFLSEDSKEAIVAFRGTATNEWTDDFLGANQIDSLQQINCLEWYKMVYNKLHLIDYHVTVVGHSKGGNKAKYITILNDTVQRCVSFDGQGFSDKFMNHYKDRILKRQDVIENHNIDYDFVNILMNDIGVKNYYFGYGYGHGGFAESHAPNTFFDFSSLGNYEMRLNPDGQASEMKVLSQFINSMIRSAYDDKERSENNKLVGTLVEKGFSIIEKEICLEDFIKVLFDLVSNELYKENFAYLISYVIKYAKQNEDFIPALKGVMNHFNNENGVKIIDVVADLVNSKKLNAILSVSNFLINHANKFICKRIQSYLIKKYDITLSIDQIQQLLQIISLIKQTIKELEINFDGSGITVTESVINENDIDDKLDIVVLSGGLSYERNMSLHTGYMVYKELMKLGHNVILLDSYMGYGEEEILIDNPFSDSEKYSLEISKIEDDIPDLWAVKKRRMSDSTSYFGPNVIQICKKADLVFLALHGENGDNGKVQATFDLLGIDYTGTDYASSHISSNKMLSKQIFNENGINTCKGYTLIKGNKILEPKDLNINYPVIIKPNNGGIGLGISLAKDKKSYYKSLDEAFLWDDEVLVEEYINGREFSVGILDNKALPVLEILPLNCKNRDLGDNLDVIKAKRCPAEIDEHLSNKLQKLALKASNSLNLKCYSKVDFILKDSGEIICVECDSLPQLNPYSYLAVMAKEDGITFDKFLSKIIQLSLNKKM
ncbi:MAG: ATP-grasp domain-containing protein [Acholeplasmatales bacterium]|nr:ATP-grasp domain-containing protein [Acholeplasmatales bacterium]